MTVFLLLYLCADASRTDCQVVKADSWNGPHAYEQCIGTVPVLTNALTAPNRDRHQFICEIQADNSQSAKHAARPTLIHQSFRM